MNALIADGYQVIRKGVSLLLKEYWPGICVHEAASFSELLKILSDQPIDLLILEINIPGGDHLRMIDQIKIKQPCVKTLIFSEYKEQLYAERYLKSGANGYLQKDASDSEMKRAIEVVLNNGYYLSATMTNALVTQMLFNEKMLIETPFNKLSDREADVAHLLVKGLGVMEVSIKLTLHKTTVSTYKARIFKKLNISNMAELIEKFRFKEQINL